MSPAGPLGFEQDDASQHLHFALVKGEVREGDQGSPQTLMTAPAPCHREKHRNTGHW